MTREFAKIAVPITIYCAMLMWLNRKKKENENDNHDQ